jgi:hypothetical protein
MKTMDWDDRVWIALKDAVSDMPTFVRKKALKKIIVVSEKNARDRESDLVEAPDLMNAIDKTVPGPIKSMCKEALKNAGLVFED